MHSRNVLAPAVALAALVGLLFVAPASALASAARDSGSTTPSSATNAASGTGWVRLAHLSPDTAGVDIQLTALTGGKVVESLTDVVYGQVSSYLALPQGTYVVSMASTGQSMTTPVIQTSLNITAGQPITVAAYGKNADLRSVVFTDDLTAPGTGQARIRVVQASTSVPTVNIATSTGLVVAAGAEEGTATPYANVPAGDWMLKLTGASGAPGVIERNGFIGRIGFTGFIERIECIDGRGEPGAGVGLDPLRTRQREWRCNCRCSHRCLKRRRPSHGRHSDRRRRDGYTCCTRAVRFRDRAQ